MSRRMSRQNQRGPAPRRKAQIAVAVTVLVSLFAAWTMLASSGAPDLAGTQKGGKGGTVSLASFNPNSPSKEYVYAGGRLVATEEPPPSQVNYQGSLDGAGCNTISGWAWDANNPGATVSVDVYEGVTLLGSASANLFREDLLNIFGSGNHGFSFNTPANLRNDQPHSISVKFAGTVTELWNSPKTVTCTSPTPLLQGGHNGFGCNMIVGWAWDSTDPNGTINVDIYNVDNPAQPVFIGTAIATQYRQDLVDAGFPNGYHGFSFPTPASLKNGQVHTVRVKFSGTTLDLTWGTPMSNACSGGAQLLQGNHEAADCSRITGWAWDQNDPNMPINVAIYDGPALLAVVTAIQFRQDLANEGIGNGYHGFTLSVPASLKNNQAHLITVKYSGTSTNVAGTPRTITCAP